MNIINVGGWYGGNTAVMDWMRGFDEIAFVDGEFNILRLEGGIMDLIAEKDKSKKLKLIHLLKRECYIGYYKILRTFVARYTKNYFKTLPSKKHTGYLKFYRDLYSYLSNYENMIKKSALFDEVSFWKPWISSLGNLGYPHKKYNFTVFHNPFYYKEQFDGHYNIWPDLFSPYKMIFIHRDPLDQFTDIVKDGAHLKASVPRFHGETKDMHPADRFLHISKKIYLARIRLASLHTKNQLIIFSFEDFINKHDRVTSDLKCFLDIKSQRDPKNTRFVKEQSILNIGKGQFSEEVKSLLKGKPYVLCELNELRQQLIQHPNAI